MLFRSSFLRCPQTTFSPQIEKAQGGFWKGLHGGEDESQAVSHVFVGGTSQGWGVSWGTNTHTHTLSKLIAITGTHRVSYIKGIDLLTP